jgi:hypothetical protein
MTQALRYSKQSSNTGEKLNCILSTISDANVEQVILFATPGNPTSDYNDSDGAETNLPEVAALAVGTFAGAKVAAVFDGAFLCAARIPRYLEVKALLDAAIASDKVYFAKHRAPFTSKKADVDALTILLNLGPFEKLTTTSRSQYFSLLSNMTEAALQQL